MDDLASGTKRQFKNLLDAAAEEPLIEEYGLPTLTRLGPCVGDDGGGCSREGRAPAPNGQRFGGLNNGQRDIRH